MDEIFSLPGFDKDKVPKHIRIAYITRGINGIGGIGTDTSKILWDGIRTTARELGIELFTFVGGQFSTEINNYIYDLINDNWIDGIITWANSKADEALTLLSRFKNTPIITLSVDLNKYPVVLIDNKTGMINLLTHLIEIHGVRKIGFVQGPVTHASAIARLDAYAETLKAYNISFDKKLISEPLEWNKLTGVKAVELLLDNRGLIPGKDIEAIVCVNDRISIGVIDALKERGYSCPDDIIVTGCNNLDEAKSHTPSITSIAMPFYDQASYSVKLLKELIETGSVKRLNKMPSISVIHESCGCPNKWTNTDYPKAISNFNITETVSELKRLRDKILCGLNLPEYYIEFLSNKNDSGMLLDSFISSLGDFNCKLMHKAIKNILNSNKRVPLDLYQWQTFFSFLRNSVYSITDNKQALLVCENILTCSLGLIMDLNIKNGSIKQMESIVQAENVQRIDRHLSETLDLSSVIEAMAVLLPETGIPSFFMVLFDSDSIETENRLPEYARLKLAYYNNRRMELPKSGTKFKTVEIIPRELPYEEGVKTYLFRALSFRDEKLGYLVFEMGPDDGSLYEMLTQKLADSIKSAHLAEELKNINENLEASIQELKLTQEQLVEAEKMAALGELVVGIAHEINTPLGVCITASSYLELKFQELKNLKNLNTADIDETLGIVLRNLENVAKLIQNFKQITLDFSAENSMDINLNDFFNNLKAFSKDTLEMKNITFNVICNPSLTILTNNEILFIIFSNLVKNSIIHGFEFSDRGNIGITVLEYDKYIRIVYCDNGKGLDKNTQEKIFNPFFTTKRGAGGGSGLGMHIVYNLVTQKLKGKIKCISNNGVEFTIDIPK